MKKILFAAWLSLVALETKAAVVFDQPPTGTGALLMSSRYQPNGTDYDAWVWDSFSVPTAQAVTEIRWRGGYNPALAYWGGDILNFKVSIYESTPGLSQPLLGAQYPATPATLISYDTGNAAGETSAGMFGGVELFDYHSVLPTVFQAQAGKLYWVQIEAEMGNGLPDWGLGTGTGNGSYFRRLAGGSDMIFQFVPGDAAFSIVTSDGPIYTIAASASPAGSGTIANPGLYPNNSAAPLVAVPNAGYAFVNWTENGTVVSTAPNYTFTVSSNRTLVANFATGSVVTTTAVPLVGGNTDGGGSFVNGRSITVEATPAANYLFENWTEGGVPVSTNAAYTFAVTVDRDLVANFTPAATNPGIVFSQPPNASSNLLLSSYQLPDGNVDGMEYRFEKFTLAATTDISQVRWRGGYVGNNQAGNPVVEFVITIYGATANGFYPDLDNPHLEKYIITGDAGQIPAGVVGGVQMFDYAVTLPTSFPATNGVSYWIQIEASQYGLPLTWGFTCGAGGDNAHYRRVGNSYYAGAGDLALTLSAPTATSYTIAASPANPSSGSVSGAGTFAPDTAVPLLAMPKPGYAFVNWTEAVTIVSAAALYQFPASANRTLVAHFAPTYQVTLSSSALTMGTVAGAGTYPTGSNVTARATARPGFIFVNWTEGGIPVSALANYPFTVTAPRTLVANFAVPPAVISPRLSFAPASPGTLVLQWPTNAPGFLLQQNFDLTTTNWADATNAVSVVGTNNEVIIPQSSGKAFFRLKRP